MADLFDRAHLRLLSLRGYRRHRIATPAGRVHAISAKGRGKKPLVVLHGLAAASHHYEGVLEGARDFASHVIGIDLLGHGLSDRPDTASFSGLEEALITSIDAVLEQVSSRRAAVVFGNSLGGAAAVRYAHRRAERVAGLFLVAPGGAPLSSPERAELLGRFDLHSHDKALDFVDALFHRPHTFRQLLAWGTRRRFADPAIRALLDSHGDDALAADNSLGPAELAGLSMPVHLLWGDADRILPASSLGFFEEYLPSHATIERVSHFGHVPHMDHGPDVMARLRAFVSRVNAEEERSPAPRQVSRTAP